MNALLKLDHGLSKAIHRAAGSNAVTRKLAEVGASGLLFFMAGMLFMSVNGGHFYLPTLLIVLFCIAPAWALTLALEYLCKRKRPYERAGEKLGVPMLWYTPSFPSGHATIAFAVAAVSMVAGLSTWPLFLVCAFIVAFCRVAVGVHYVSDVIVGGLIGWFVVLLCAQAVLVVRHLPQPALDNL